VLLDEIFSGISCFSAYFFVKPNLPAGEDTEILEILRDIGDIEGN
jgi:hypothetical protein